MQTLGPEQLQEILAAPDAGPRLIDVRERWEYELCRIEGSENIPMSEVPGRMDELDRERHTVFICHHGARSRQVADYLESMGFTQVANLEGGLDAWADTVDPDMPRY